MESKTISLINSSPLTDCLQALSHRRNVASFALFHRYFHANCSSDLANCVPPLLPRPRCTRLASSSHPYSVHLSNARVNQYSQSFIPFSGKLWNSLPASAFPPAYGLNFFKGKVSRYLCHSFGSRIWTFPGMGTSVTFFVLFLLALAASLLHKKTPLPYASRFIQETSLIHPRITGTLSRSPAGSVIYLSNLQPRDIPSFVHIVTVLLYMTTIYIQNPSSNFFPRSDRHLNILAHSSLSSSVCPCSTLLTTSI